MGGVSYARLFGRLLPVPENAPHVVRIALTFPIVLPICEGWWFLRSVASRNPQAEPQNERLYRSNFRRARSSQAERLAGGIRWRRAFGRIRPQLRACLRDCRRGPFGSRALSEVEASAGS